MRHTPCCLIVFVGMALCGGLVYGQGSLGAIPKRPRTLEDYKPSTLKEIAAMPAKRDELLPLRARLVYTASVRPISTNSNDVLHSWAQCCAGNPDHYTKTYLSEMRFVENGASFWVAVQERLIADFQTELKVGEGLELFFIRVSVRRTNGKRGSVLLAERYQRAGRNSDQMNESLDWIKNNLPSHAEKDLTVEVSGPCQLKITDTSNSNSLSKAVVFLPLTDLDPAKVKVLSRQGIDTSEFHLSTRANKRSILFILYQGVPAEGGQASEYSLTMRNREKAEAMAEAFRRAINLCAADGASR